MRSWSGSRPTSRSSTTPRTRSFSARRRSRCATSGSSVPARSSWLTVGGCSTARRGRAIGIRRCSPGCRPGSRLVPTPTHRSCYRLSRPRTSFPARPPGLPAVTRRSALLERPRPDTAAGAARGPRPTIRELSQLVRGPRRVVRERAPRLARRLEAWRKEGEVGVPRSALRGPTDHDLRERVVADECPRRARHGGDDRARILRRAGTVRRRGDARDARPRDPPRAGAARRSANRSACSPTPTCLRPRPEPRSLASVLYRRGRDP